MSDDHLRDRMSASNPVPPSHPVDPVTSDRARSLMEGIMSTPTSETTSETNRETNSEAGDTRNGTGMRRRTRLVTAIAAALVILTGVGGFIASRGSQPESPPLVLSAEGGNALASCLQFDVDILADMSPAFAGTVTELTDSVATIDVDKWYTGGDADTVEIQYQPGFEALIGTPNLEVGQRYLITATAGTVNGCGYSGPATADLEAAFDQAFGG